MEADHHFAPLIGTGFMQVNKTISVLFTFFLMNSGIAQKLEIPLPANTTSETAARIQSEYEQEIENFANLLLEIDRKRFYPETDSLEILIEKQNELNSSLSSWTKDFRKKMAAPAMVFNYV